MREEIRKRIDTIRHGEVPTGYKKTKVGIVPEEWEIDSVKNTITIQNQLRTPISKELRAEMQGEYPYYGPTQVQDYINRYSVEGKAVLIGEDGDHFLKYAEKEMTLLVDGKYSVNNHAHIIRGTDKCSEEWFYYVFMHKSLLNKVTRQGASRYKLTKESLGDINFQLPSSKEQERITSILTFCDKRIDLQSKLIEQKQNQKKWLVQSLLTGKKRVDGFMGEWREVELKEFLQESKEIMAPDLERRLTVKLNLKGVEKRKINSTEKEKATIQYRRKKGQFIYGKQNLYKGAFGIIPDHLDEFQSSADIPSFDVSSTVNVKWVYYYFSQEAFYKNLESIASGTGSKRIQVNDFLKIKIPVPSRKEQDKIIELFTAFDYEITLLQQQLELYKQEKKAMMQLLLTGIVRVNESDG